MKVTQENQVPNSGQETTEDRHGPPPLVFIAVVRASDAKDKGYHVRRDLYLDGLGLQISVDHILPLIVATEFE